MLERKAYFYKNARRGIGFRNPLWQTDDRVSLTSRDVCTLTSYDFDAPAIQR